MPDVTLLGVHGWEQLADAGDTTLNGILFSDGFYMGSMRASTHDFADRFQRAYGEPPGLLEAQAYDAAMLAKRALDSGAQSRPEALNRLLELVLVNASDVAAMGGRPRFCVVSFGVPPAFPARDLFSVQAGIAAAARAAKTAVVGGNLTRADHLWVSITLLALAPKRLVTRRGARP